MDSIRPPLWSHLTAAELPGALRNPPDRYRPVPWLAWTGDLDWPVLKRQLADMREKGITEFFLFPIYGMELPYMSAAYWERVRQTLEFCRANGMKCWIYDEYNWPSGVCAGMLLRDHPEACEEILWMQPTGEDQTPSPLPMEVAQSGGVRWGIAKAAEIRINVQGCDWLNAMPGYLAVLDKDACRRFIESTHDRYLSEAPEFFPETIPGFFTDEPGAHTRAAGGWIGLPYASDLFADFEARYGYDLRERLLDLLVDSPEARRTRCHYWRRAAESFGEAYSAQQRAWCEAHGVALTGHCLGEDSLLTHVRMSGDLWEALKHFTIPGIDVLANADGFTYPERMSFYGPIDRRAFHLTCKYVHGVVRHSGAREMLSEAYGVCDWGMNLFRQKRGFHYQVALGVTLFNDNSLVTSIADFRKYSIAGKHFTQPWWRHYRQYAEYNARLAALHAEGEPMADIAVIFPRSTLWARADAALYRGDWFRTADGHPLGELQTLIYDLLDELIRGLYHFDFVFEPVLAEADLSGTELITPHARYRALVVSSATDLPQACMDVVTRFAQAGGVVIFAGDLPEREVDSQADLAVSVEQALQGTKAAQVPASGSAVCEALTPHVRRPVTLSGEGAREFVCSWRQLADTDLVFIANMAEKPVGLTVRTDLPLPIVVLDPDTLEAYRPVPDAGTFAWHFGPWQACVLVAGGAAQALAPDSAPPAPLWLCPQGVETLDGPWDFAIEPGNMLRLTCDVRPDPNNRGAAEGWHRDTGAEGWITPEGRWLPEPIKPGDAPWYWMRARVTCDPGALPQRIVADNPDFLEGFVNGQPARQVPGEPLWTEENVHFDVTGMLAEGENWVHLRVRTSKYNDPRIAPMPGATNRLLQPVVLVGEFLVGEEGLLTPWTGKLRCDAPWESQGLPHVASVGIYRRVVEWSGEGRVLLHLPECNDAVEVAVNGTTCGVRVWPPYVFDLTPALRPGDDELSIRVANTLGNIILETYAGQQPSAYPASGLKQPPRLLLLAQDS
jgi:hypothetical protein